jgi:hypothetical protein
MSNPFNQYNINVIMDQQSIDSLKELLVDNYGFTYSELLYNNKNHFKGMVFTKLIQGKKVDLYVSYLMSERGDRRVQLRTMDKEVWLLSNKHYMEYAIECPSYGSNEVEYESRGVYMCCPAMASGEFVTSFSPFSNFAIIDMSGDFFVDENNDIKRVLGKEKKWYQFW